MHKLAESDRFMDVLAQQEVVNHVLINPVAPFKKESVEKIHEACHLEHMTERQVRANRMVHQKKWQYLESPDTLVILVGI